MTESAGPDLVILSRNLRALAHPMRLRILSLLHERELTFGELQRETNLPPNLLTHHLVALRRMGLVEASRIAGDRRVTCYALCPDRLVTLGQVCIDLAGPPAGFVPALVAEPAAEGGPEAGSTVVFDVLAGCGDAALAVTPQRAIAFWNTAAERLLGWRASDVLGRDCGALLQCCDALGRPLSATTCAIMVCARRGQSVAAQDLRVTDAAGAERWVNATTIVLGDGDRALRSIVHILRDVTRQKALERFVQTLQREAVAVMNGMRLEGPARGDARTVPLTDREREVLILLADGADTTAIAARLCIGRSTARKHVQSILNKFGVHHRLEAIAHAHRLGLLPSGS